MDPCGTASASSSGATSLSEPASLCRASGTGRRSAPASSAPGPALSSRAGAASAGPGARCRRCRACRGRCPRSTGPEAAADAALSGGPVRETRSRPAPGPRRARRPLRVGPGRDAGRGREARRGGVGTAARAAPGPPTAPTGRVHPSRDVKGPARALAARPAVGEGRRSSAGSRSGPWRPRALAFSSTTAPPPAPPHGPASVLGPPPPV